MKEIAVITGASSGLGKLFAQEIDASEKIDEIWLVARNEKALRSTAVELHHTTRIFSLDLTQADALVHLEEALSSSPVSIAWLINASGFGKFGKVKTMSKEDISNMVLLNCKALAELSRLSLEYMHAGAHIINVASAAAIVPQPYLSVYAATKSFVKSFSLSLRQEVKKERITVSALCPRFMKTHFLDKPGDDASVKRFMWVGFESPTHCVTKALKKAKKNKGIIFTSFAVACANIACKILPETFTTSLEAALGQIAYNKNQKD